LRCVVSSRVGTSCAAGDMSSRAGTFDAVGDGNPVPERVGCPRLERTAPGRVECPRRRRVESETLLDMVADAQTLGIYNDDPAEIR